MLSAEQLREAIGPSAGAFLLAALGFPVDPQPLVASELRRAGLDVPFSDDASLAAAVRQPLLWLFTVRDDDLTDESAGRFLRSLESWNVCAKFALVATSPCGARLRIWDRASRGRVRRLDVDLAAPRDGSLERLRLLARDGDPRRSFDAALDRDLLARQFFDRFRAATEAVTAEARAQLPDEEPDAVRSWALLVMSRLLFLSFVQEHGWLDGDRRFLRTRVHRCHERGGTVFRDLVAPLFFGCLNTPVERRDPLSTAIGRIPYLNGGLFEPTSFEQRHGDLSLSNDLLCRVVDEVFDRFLFSTDETDASGTHVDPEMLGHVFESLMEEEQRAASGTFYTPASIVDVLVRRAVVAWLSDGDRPLANALHALVEGRRAPIPRDLAAALLERLRSITVLDPACGSGAFLLSALSVIERLTLALAGEAGVSVEPSLRQRIVERSLYGVDLKAEAVRLCELRLWLAIAAASTVSPDAVPPLPNLDRNILQGNSLLGPADFLGDGRADVYRAWVYGLRSQSALLARYRTAARDERPLLARAIRTNDLRIATEMLGASVARDRAELASLRHPLPDLFGNARAQASRRDGEITRRIAAAEAELGRVARGELAWFSFDVHFANAMAAGGFDLVVGNPPWVRLGRLAPNERVQLSERYGAFRGGGRGFRQPDAWVAFVERALSLAAPAGIVAMLVPAKLLSAGYASTIRRKLERSEILAIDDWSAQPHLFDADTFPLGITVRRRTPAAASPVEVSAGGSSFVSSAAHLVLGDSWCLLPPSIGSTVRRLWRLHPPLAEAMKCRPVMGVKTGANAAFFLDVAETAEAGVTTRDGTTIPWQFVCRCVRGRDLRAWAARGAEWMLWPPERWTEKPAWATRWARRHGLALHDLRLAYRLEDHLAHKVVWKDVAQRLVAAVLPRTTTLHGRQVPLVANQTLYQVALSSEDDADVLCAILNSTIASVLALATAERAKDGHARFFARTLAEIPFAFPRRRSTRYAELLRMGRDARSSATPPDPQRLDEAVADLYGATPRELRAMQEWLKERIGR